MAIEHVQDHADQAIERLLTQYRERVRFEGWIRANAGATQTAEDAFWAIYTCDDLTTATASQLDDLGEMVGQLRGSLSDTQLRVMIAARVLINTGSGTGDELNEILEIVMSLLGSNVVTIREDFPATIVAVVAGAWAGLGASSTLVASIIRTARAAGVRSILEWSEAAAAASFRCAPVGGYDDATTLTGPELAGVSTLHAPAGTTAGWPATGSIYIDRDGDDGEVVQYTAINSAVDITLATATVFAHADGVALELLGDAGGFGHVAAASSTLAAGSLLGATALVLADASSFPVGGGTVTIEAIGAVGEEDIEYSAVAGSDLTLTTPAAAAHALGAAVRLSSTDGRGGKFATARE